MKRHLAITASTLALVVCAAGFLMAHGGNTTARTPGYVGDDPVAKAAQAGLTSSSAADGMPPFPVRGGRKQPVTETAGEENPTTPDATAPANRPQPAIASAPAPAPAPQVAASPVEQPAPVSEDPPTDESDSDSIARAALRGVGIDPEAEAAWITAINDPSLSPEQRKNLIEDLNEEGFSDPQNITQADLPLIVYRLTLIVNLAPEAMDEVNAEAFLEAYKDLGNMYFRLNPR